MTMCSGVLGTQLRAPAPQRIGLQDTPPFAQAQQAIELTDQLTRICAESPRLKRFLEHYVEPVSMKNHCTHLFSTNCASLAVRFGPVILERFSQDQGEFYEVSSHFHGFGVAIHLHWRWLGRMTFTSFILPRSLHCPTFSMRWNFSFPGVVPNTASIMQLARSGDIGGMEALFKAGKASPTDVRPDGASLLHVSFMRLSVCSSFS